MSAISGIAGEVLWGSAVNITGITKAASAVITVSSVSGFSIGDRVIIQGVTGMTEINDKHGTITAITTTPSITITVDIDSSAYTTYVSGGTVTHVVDVTKFSFTKKGSVSNVTDSSSSTWEDFIASGFIAITGTFEGFLKSGVNKPTFHSAITFKLYEDATDYISGSGIITDEGTTLEINGTNAVHITFSFQGTGSYTDTN